MNISKDKTPSPDTIPTDHHPDALSQIVINGDITPPKKYLPVFTS
jgi:hypothetical protein